MDFATSSPSSPDDEPEVIFYEIIYSHLNVLVRYVLGLSLNWTTLVYCCHSMQLFFMRPEIFALVIAIVLVVFFGQTSDVWINLLANGLRSPIYKLTSSRFLSSLFWKNYWSDDDDLLSFFGDQTSEFKKPNIGIYALQGRRPKMEDKFNYCDAKESLGVEFFAVYDGHGGDSAANYAQEKMFDEFKKRLDATDATALVKGKTVNNVASESGNVDKEHTLKESESKDERKESERNGKLDDDHSNTKHDDRSEVKTREQTISNVLTETFLSIDKEIVEKLKRVGDVAGSTGLVAVTIHNHGSQKLVVANVGDSRGVICDSNGKTIPLSYDHKPQQIKEHKRIKEAGGFIKFNGVWRVAGILATSRAFGDYPLKEKSLVIAEPDILTFNLTDIKPQFMILASDGLWDTFSNEEAVNYVKDNYNSMKSKSSKNDIAFELAKSLTMESYQRGSFDNITVIVVLFDDHSKTVANGRMKKSSNVSGSRTIT